MKVNSEMIKGMQAKAETREPEQVQKKSVYSESTQNDGSSTSKSDFRAINKDGDTLEITDGSGIKSASAVKLTDAVLTRYSSGKLKQLLSQGQISRQQFDKAMKKRQSK